MNDLNKCIELDPNYDKAYYKIGKILEENNGQYNDAANFYGEALR